MAPAVGTETVVLGRDPSASPAPTTGVPLVGSGAVGQAAGKVLPSSVSISAGSSSGSGFVLSTAGYVLTNNHVIDQTTGSVGGLGAQRIVVELKDRTRLRATLVGRDPMADVAVLKVDPPASGLVPVVFADSDQVRIGDQVIAVGSPLGLAATVTSGIVSALRRPVLIDSEGGDLTALDAIQTDAPINPGNSGGALADLQGRVVGVNSAIAQAPGGGDGNIGVGFAIPINQARRIADEIIRTGKSTRAVLGVVPSDATGDEAGAIVDELTAGGGAAAAGLKVGDRIVRVADRPISGAEDLIAAVRGQVPGATVPVEYVRGGRTVTVDVRLGREPTS